MAALLETLMCVTLLCILGDNFVLSSRETSRDFNTMQGSSRDTGHLSDGLKYPFVVYWNVPSHACSKKFNIDLQLNLHSITANTGQNYKGDKIVLFYEAELGYYPHFDETSQPVNGGLPQVANLSSHLQKATEDVLHAIPDPQFDGVAIIDWESWRPQWKQNFDSRLIYREKSIELVYREHPELPNEDIELVAKTEFEQAAENWMKSTLELVKSLRPNARWGFYHFPYCNNNHIPVHCTRNAVLTNNNITWLFDSSTALYPSIYLHESNERKSDFVRAIVSEAFRVRNQSRNRFVDVYPYTRYVYSRSEALLTKRDLNNTVLQSAEMGSNGVVIWGTVNDIHTTDSCVQLQSYINTTLGPFVKKLVDAATLCSAEFCSGNGRCVGNILKCSRLLSEGRESVDELEVNRSDDLERWQQTQMPCSCQCYEGWTGFFCDLFE